MDALGNPIHIHLSPGNINDCTQAIPALEKVPIQGSIINADKAYGSKAIRKYIEQAGATYCIPPRDDMSNRWEYDRQQYKRRHLVECFFQKLKQFRRIATRFDKLAARFLAFVHLACIMTWLA